MSMKQTGSSLQYSESQSRGFACKMQTTGFCTCLEHMLNLLLLLQRENKACKQTLDVSHQADIPMIGQLHLLNQFGQVGSPDHFKL